MHSSRYTAEDLNSVPCDGFWKGSYQGHEVCRNGSRRPLMFPSLFRSIHLRCCCVPRLALGPGEWLHSGSGIWPLSLLLWPSVLPASFPAHPSSPPSCYPLSLQPKGSSYKADPMIACPASCALLFVRTACVFAGWGEASFCHAHPLHLHGAKAGPQSISVIFCPLQAG